MKTKIGLTSEALTGIDTDKQLESLQQTMYQTLSRNSLPHYFSEIPNYKHMKNYFLIALLTFAATTGLALTPGPDWPCRKPITFADNYKNSDEVIFVDFKKISEKEFWAEYVVKKVFKGGLKEGQHLLAIYIPENFYNPTNMSLLLFGKSKEEKNFIKFYQNNCHGFFILNSANSSEFTAQFNNIERDKLGK